MGAKGYRRVVATNRRARYDYELGERFEAGLVLQGTEVKILRGGHATVGDGYIALEDGEAWVYQVQIPIYRFGSRENHEPMRKRKLLLTLRELARLERNLATKGVSAVPLELFFAGPWAKLAFAIGRGKKKHDKRQAERASEDRREIRRALER